MDVNSSFLAPISWTLLFMSYLLQVRGQSAVQLLQGDFLWGQAEAPAAVRSFSSSCAVVHQASLSMIVTGIQSCLDRAACTKNLPRRHLISHLCRLSDVWTSRSDSSILLHTHCSFNMSFSAEIQMQIVQFESGATCLSSAAVSSPRCGCEALRFPVECFYFRCVRTWWSSG